MQLTNHTRMSQEQQQQGQSNVRVIPIFVEGRDEPVINRDFPDGGGPGPQVHHHDVPPQAAPPRMQPQPDLDFGRELPSFDRELPSFRHGSIFDRAKDFPVRNIRDEFFRDHMSPNRAESPLRNHMFSNEPTVHRFGRGPSPQPQERPRTNSGSFDPRQSAQQQQPQQQQQQMPPQQRKRTSSRNEDQQYHHQPPPPQPQSAPTQQPSQQQHAPQRTQSPQPPQKEATPPPPPKPKLGPIEKIQQIQRDVLDLMTKVEQFQGKGKRDKEYLYLDEMLTQNLLKLDTVDTDGQENVKLARKEAVKCINRCLNVLEAKAEANEDVAKSGSDSSVEKTQDAATLNQSSSTTQVEIEHVPSGSELAKDNQEPVKQSSRGSIYDNHDPSTEEQKAVENNSGASAPKSKESTPQPQSKSKESTPVPSNAPVTQASDSQVNGQA